MNMKALNFIEINKRSGWQVAPLRKKVMRLNKVCYHLTCVDGKSRTGT